VSERSELEDVLKKAIAHVENGQSAVVDVKVASGC
jgi:hypothetical protein